MPYGDRGSGVRRGRSGSRRDEDVVKIHGVHAVRSIVAQRPDAIVRAYVDDARKVGFRELMRKLAERRIAYRLVPTAELDRVCQSRHHEDICVLAKPRPQPSLEEWIKGCPAAALVVVLDGVDNPHNIGAVVRSAAHFGAAGLWYTGQATMRGAAARVAEGGAEAVELFAVSSVVPVLLGLARAGFAVLGTSNQGTHSLFEHRFARRTALVLGSERGGLSAETQRILEGSLRIPGTGAVESLNVASAAAVLMAEYRRQRPLGTEVSGDP